MRSETKNAIKDVTKNTFYYAIRDAIKAATKDAFKDSNECAIKNDQEHLKYSIEGTIKDAINDINILCSTQSIYIFITVN